MGGPSTFSVLKDKCNWGRVRAIISNSNQYELLKEKFSNEEADKEIWLGIARTSTGTLNIFTYINYINDYINYIISYNKQ